MIKENMEEASSTFAKHIGGLTVKKINDSNYEFYAEVKDVNLNTSKIAHGGFICSIADTGTVSYTHLTLPTTPYV